MTGAADARKVALETEFEKNPALLYAAVRNILLRKGKTGGDRSKLRAEPSLCI